MNILWFHDGNDRIWMLDAETIIKNNLISRTTKIYKDLIHLYGDINELKDDDHVTLIASGPSCRQAVSLVIDMKQIARVFVVEYEPLVPVEKKEEENFRRRHPPSMDFELYKQSNLPTTNSVNGRNILITDWFCQKSISKDPYIMATLISIGIILVIFNETVACIHWFITLFPFIEQIHKKYLIKSIQSPIMTVFMDFFKALLRSEPIDSKLSLVGYYSLSRLHAVRYEEFSFMLSYSILVTIHLQKNNIQDIYYRVDLAAKFRKRAQQIYKSLALHLYNDTMEIAQMAETSGEQVDYKKNGRIFASMAMIFLERKMYGMTIHYLNQAVDQYFKHDPHCPPLDVYMTRAVVQEMLWQVTKSRKYLNASLYDLKQIEQNEHLFDENVSYRSLLFNMFTIYAELGRYPLALDCLDRALLQPDDGVCRLIDIYRGRGTMFIELDQLDLAVDSFNKALELCSSSDKQGEVTMNIALAITYERKEEWDKALEYLTKALIIYEQNNDNDVFSNNYPSSEIVHRHLSIVYGKVNNSDLAGVHKEKAIIEKERLSRLGVRYNGANDLRGFTVSCFLDQITVAADYTIPYELLL